jgi:hypothetical protein
MFGSLIPIYRERFICILVFVFCDFRLIIYHNFTIPIQQIKAEFQEGKIPLTAVKKFLKNNGRQLNNGGLLTILQKTKDDGVGLILCYTHK